MSTDWIRSPGWSPEIRRGLEALLTTSHPAPLAALDFDETCIRGDISETLLADLEAEGTVPLVAPYLAAVEQDALAAYVALTGTLVGGRTEAEIRAFTLKTLAAGRAEGRIRIRDTMRELIWAMHRHRWEVWIVTASPTAIVRPVAERLGIHPDRVLGMDCPRDERGRYLPEVIAPVTYRQGKIDALRAATGRDPTFAAGDSRGDAQLLANAHHALLFDRGDAALRSEATAAGWWIQPTESMPCA